MAEGKPTLFIIAGPEGSGKSTYKASIDAEHGRLAPHLKGNHIGGDKSFSGDKVQTAVLNEQGTRAFGAGNQIAHQQAREAVGRKESFSYETSFSNRQDLALIDQAKANGYRVVLTHIQTQKPELNVARVAERVREGGRDAPADSVRRDFQESPKLIAEASKKADHTFVMDSSALNTAPRHVATLERGRITNAVPAAEMPAWAKEAYSQQLQQHRDSRTTAAEKSFAAAIDKAEQRSPGATVKVAGHQPGSFSGPIVEQTAHHALQQTGPKEYVAHLNARLAVEAKKDQDVTISYSPTREPGKVAYNAPQARDAEQLKTEVRQFLTQPREFTANNPRITAAYAAYDALSNKAWEANPRTDAVEKSVDASIKQSIAARLASGKPIEVSQQSVDAVRYQVAARSLDSALQDRLLKPEAQIKIDPEHRAMIVKGAETMTRQAEGKLVTIQEKSPAFKEAERIATQLAKHDGPRTETPFASKDLASAYQNTQASQLREATQAKQQEQQRQASRGMDR